jgi:ArsR family transcriptional regulator
MYFYVKIITMAQAKSELFDIDLQKTSLYFKALGHPARLMIISFLADCKTCFTGDVTSELPLGRTTINQHLAELKKAGLIKGHISGNKTSYCLNTEAVIEMKAEISGFLEGLDTTGLFQCE